MNKIVYLFGAGASRNALPIVNEIPSRIKNLVELLKKDELQLSLADKFDVGDKSKNEYQKEIIQKLEWLLVESKNHASIDTFAKKLKIKGLSEVLRELKIILSIFFVFEQTLNKPDKRYDSFFASIHSRLFDFPSNIRILSWNYDYQFELSYNEYVNSADIKIIQEGLNINHKYGDNKNKEGFGIYKLNGTTGLISNDGREYLYATSLNVKVDINYVEEVTRSYVVARDYSNISSNFSFAWEGEYPEKSIVQSAMDTSVDATALVIIGYSFPFFNREIDRKIIGNMNNLKSVYFQAPDADILIERFKAIRDDLSGIELIPKYDLEQFVLPNEL